MAVSLNRIASAIAMDRWEEIGENTNIWNPEEETTDISIDPLYVVCSEIRNNVDTDSMSLYNTMKKLSDDPAELEKMQIEITPEDMMIAKEIRTHFRNKLTMRTLKGLHISGFMQTVQQILDNDKSFNQEMIPVLVKLPLFYQEDIETTAIFKHAENPKKIKKMTRIEIDTELFPLGSVERDSRMQKIETFYFIDNKKMLFGVNAKKNSVDAKAWKYLLGKDKIRVSGTARRTPKPGQEVFYFELQADIEIKD